MAFLLMIGGFLAVLHVPPISRLPAIEELRAKTAVAMGLGLLITGVMHFTGPDRFVAMMPPWLGWHLGLVYASGLAELVCGAGLIIPRTRRVAAWGAIALFLAILPANIHVAMSGGAVEGLPLQAWYYWLRLPLQFVYIGWAWWSR